MDIHAAVKIHAVDTNGGIIFDTEIDMFGDTEAEVTRFRKVPFLEFVLLDLEASFEDLFRLGSSHGDVYGDLLVATNTKGADGITSFA